MTYQSFVAIAGKPSAPLWSMYSKLPPIGNVEEEILGVPSIHDLGYKDVKQVMPSFI